MYRLALTPRYELESTPLQTLASPVDQAKMPEVIAEVSFDESLDLFYVASRVESLR